MSEMQTGFIRMVVLFLAFGMGCTGAGSDKSQEFKKGNNVMNKNTYPVIFADAQRSSFIDITSPAEGFLTWKKFFDEEDQKPLNPRSILTGGVNIFVYSKDSILCYNTDGEKLWSVGIRESSPVSLFDDRLYHRKIEAIDELAALSFNGRENNTTIWILASDNACSPLYIEPMDKEFLVLSLCTAPPEQGQPAYIVYRKKYQTEKYIWSIRLSGRPAAPPLHIGGMERLIVFSESDIMVCNAATDNPEGEIIYRFEYPAGEIINASADKEGSLYIFSKEGDAVFLTALASDGTEKWRYDAEVSAESQVSQQPPVIGVGGLVHFPTGRTLKTIRDGEVIGEFTIEERAIDYCSALADGSVLIAAKNSLYRTDADGNKLFGLLFDHEIVVPPVADAGGHVYIATDYELIRID
jgi:outer membrane protein assembly factor BamB